LTRVFPTEAIVLSYRKLGEADRIVDLFTEQNGRVPTVVKGSRKVGSRWGGRLEPFTRLQAQLYPGRSLHTLTGADTIDTNSIIRSDPARLRAAQSVVDMICRSTPEHQRKPRTYNLLLHFLAALGTTHEPQVLALSAQLKMLLLAGFLPQLSACAQCGAVDGLVFFSARAGGALCANCRSDAFAVEAASLDAMRQLIENPLAKTAPGIPPEQRRGIRRAIREICEYHLGVRLKVDPW
jgi:DNA repair protein RecO (recombination protein O)